MWHAERVPLSSDWWLKSRPSCRPANTQAAAVLAGTWGGGGGVGDWAQRRADKWRWRSRVHPLFSNSNATYSYSGARHCKKHHLDARQRFHQEINLWSFSNWPGIFFYESYTVIYENIIPAVYAAVIDLFMKTAIVLRSVGGSQNRWTTSSGSHCSVNATETPRLPLPPR